MAKRVSSDTRLAPQVAAHLAEARKALSDIMAEHGEIALAALTDPDGGIRLAEWEGRRKQAEQHVANVAAAYEMALRKDARSDADKLAKTRQTDIRRITQQLALHQKAIGKLCAAIEDVQAAFRDAVRFGADAKTTAELAGFEWPLWATTGDAVRLKDAIRIEFGRRDAQDGAAIQGGVGLEGLFEAEEQYDPALGRAPLTAAMAAERAKLLSLIRGEALPDIVPKPRTELRTVAVHELVPILPPIWDESVHYPTNGPA